MARALTVGTWNVEYAAGAAKNERRLRRIVAQDCDLWVLTETHDDLDLRAAGYTAVSAGQRPHGRAGGRWATIWSRFPVIGVPEVRDPCRTVAALVAAPGGPLLVYGTVLPWHTDPGPDPLAPAKSWAEHHRVIPEQAAEWRALQDRLPHAALCVAGDLNTSLTGPRYYGTAKGRALLRAGMETCDLFCATETDRVPAGLLAHPPIDHVLLPAAWSDRTRVRSAWEGTEEGVRLSDHSGVVVLVEAF